MNIPSNTLRDAKRLFGRLKHLRCKLPVLQHLMLTAGQNGIQLAATDLDHWLETQVCDQPADYACFLIPPAAMDAACRADKGTDVTFAVRGGKRSPECLGRCSGATIPRSASRMARAERVQIRLTIRCGGITATSDHPTLDPSELPSRPTIIGTVTELPPTTLEGLSTVAGCASSDTSRQILNGVYFTPEDGGRLVATDDKRLACCPAIVPPQEFCLPLVACHILGHPDFTSGMATVTWIDHKEPEKRHVAIRCGRHLLVSKPLVGSYPNYKQVIPAHASHMAVIPHERKPGIIAWLRSVGKGQSAVRLDWHKRGQLTLTHRDENGHSATMQVPVEIHGNPPVIAFSSHYLADALEIGSTLCLSDELSPGICRHPTGRFCVIMPQRLVIPAGSARESEAPPPNHAKAA